MEGWIGFFITFPRLPSILRGSFPHNLMGGIEGTHRGFPSVLLGR
ncbi:hypothetical protein HMPREF9134_00743 [Porphyromonas catoniae F0037]|uniref:Uncharacterized protein n=1 Tax=Porphyromonas catoniae F0037 TaxID=1127696 RepID=L1NF34_9PORP|nr:hypothetical protein HMPREF9134_00743 [Porphyromonas catoniae F0037]